MHKNLILAMSLSVGLFSSSVLAQGFGVPLKSTVLFSEQKHYLMSPNNASNAKEIVLMNIQLSPQQMHMLNELPSSHRSYLLNGANQDLPSKVLVNLKNLPVLDQGKHGSCVTFANSAAINSLLGRGDHISQLCSLMLGEYLEERSYYPSGWDGSMGPIVLNQFLQYGIINKFQEHRQGCGGLNHYPLEQRASANLLSFKDIREYKKMSENINEQIIWDPLVTFSERFSIDPARAYQPEVVLKKVKYVLATKLAKTESRITMGALIPYKHCNTGACATHQKNYDTWAITKEIKNDPYPEVGGHEMFLIGYDDNAVAVDGDGVKHRGLFTLRNSWGEGVGDKGNFYMTYDFFMHYMDELQVIRYIKHQV